MSSLNPSNHKFSYKQILHWALIGIILIGAFLLGWLGVLVFKALPVGKTFSSLLSFIFATNSVHTTWYITRAAGWVAYFLLWFSMLWGLVIPTKFFERFLSPTFVVDFHEYISLLAIGFVVLHVGVLLFDQYLPFTLIQIFVPFLSTYRPFWVGLGVIGAYLAMLVTVTFYLRKRIGMKKFKAIHTVSMFSYLGVVLHAFFTGTDSSLGVVQLVYLSSFLVIVFLTAYWLIQARQLKKTKEARVLAPSRVKQIKH